MTGVAKNTIVKLLANLGNACAEYLNKMLVKLPCKRIQVHEILVLRRSQSKERHQENG
jgi:hypothetical protein